MPDHPDDFKTRVKSSIQILAAVNHIAPDLTLITLDINLTEGVRASWKTHIKRITYINTPDEGEVFIFLDPRTGETNTLNKLQFYSHCKLANDQYKEHTNACNTH